MGTTKTQQPEYSGMDISAPSMQNGQVDSKDLLGNKSELQIHHDGEIYRLRITRNGRLILNK